jgi:hypothetical protein
MAEILRPSSSAEPAGGSKIGICGHSPSGRFPMECRVHVLVSEYEALYKDRQPEERPLMRARLVTTAVTIAFAAPAFAADLYAPQYVPPIGDPVYTPGPMVIGHLTMGVGFTDSGVLNWDDISDPSDSTGLFVGAGRANINFGSGWNVEFETGGFSTFDDGTSNASIGAAGHVWTRLNSAALGAYGGVNFPTGGTVYTLGLEGEAYIGNLTLGGDADYNWSDGGLGTGDYWSGSLWADAYLTQNWRVGGEFEYYGDNVDTWIAGLDTEYRFGSPLSGWAKVLYSDSSGNESWAGLVGLRIFMDGGMTLIDHDRKVPWESGLLGPDQFGP